MSYEYSENELVQRSAGEFLAGELGWEVALAYNREQLGVDGTFGRRSYREIVLERYFVQALRRLNPWMTDKQVQEALTAMLAHEVSDSALQTNEKKHELLRNGIKVQEVDAEGRTTERTARVIDFEHAENNHFLALKELKIHGEVYRRRTDIVGFVNGIPVLFIELKKQGVDVQDAYPHNYTDYQDTIPQLFYYNAFVVFSEDRHAGQQVRVFPRVEALEGGGRGPRLAGDPATRRVPQGEPAGPAGELHNSMTSPPGARPRYWRVTTSTSV